VLALFVNIRHRHLVRSPRSQRDAEFVESLFRGMERLIAQWQTDLSSLDVCVAQAKQAQKRLHDWR